MMRSLDIGATGMLAQQLNVDVISENIANMTTTGFKRQRADFKDLIYQNVVRPGSESNADGTLVPAGLQLGLGVKAGAVYRIHEQGSLKVTSNPLDLAINGNGFFQIQLPDGTTAYTRDGTFQRDQNGQIVTAQGYKLLPGFTIPTDATAVQISLDGVVQVSIPGQTAMQTLGQLQTANFVNPVGLESIGNNLLLETQASGTAVTGNPQSTNFGSVVEGSIEQSNVDVVSEMTDMITAQRAYEMNSKVISTSDEMLQTVSQLR